MKNSSFEFTQRTSIIKWTFYITLAFLAISGLGQMPLYKRYYIADLPGLGWSSDFFIMHYLHYIGAAILLGILTYSVTLYILAGRKEYRITKAGYTFLTFLSILVLTGILRAIGNQAGVNFNGSFTVAVSLSHILAMFLLLISMALFSRKSNKGGFFKSRGGQV